MAFFGNSTTVNTTITKGNLQEFKAKQECKALLGEYASDSLIQSCVANKIAGVATGTKSYAELTEAQQKAVDGVSAGSREDWSAAWKAMQVNQMKKGIALQDITDPTPLLIDKISSLPADSARRRSAENIKNTLDGTALNVGSGLDNLTRESYKEIKRLVRHSDMLHTEITHGPAIPSPNQILTGRRAQFGGNFPSFKQLLGFALGNTSPALAQVLGVEEGSYVTNLQDWRPYFANAVRPISDAIGSHADVDHAFHKNAAGSAALIPVSVASKLDKMGSFLVDEAEGVFKSQQLGLLQNLPSKIAGSLRQLATGLDEILSVPFEIMSDVYNGLMQLIDEISNLLDNVLSYVIQFAFSVLGGLVDSIFPLSQLEEMLGPIFELAGELSDIFDLFGGFPAMAKISSVLSIVSGGFSSILTNGPFLYTLFKSKTVTTTMVKNYECLTEIFELTSTKLPKIPKFLKVLSAVGGVISQYGSIGQGISAFGSNLARGVSIGIGNLGSMLMGGISSTLGEAIRFTRDLDGLLAEIMSELFSKAIGRMLHWMLKGLCKLGMVGDMGFSIGDTFNFIRNSSFSKAMSIYATHHQIVAPLFGKESIPRGAYSYESAIGRFQDSVFVRGAQTHKGVTMIGPGGSVLYKPFPSLQSSYFIGGYGETMVSTSSSMLNRLAKNINSIFR